GGEVRKILFCVFIFAAFLRADWIDNAKTKAESELKPLAGDVGSVLGGGFWSPTKKGGLLGFDVGIQVSASGISDDNPVFTEDEKEGNLGAGWLYISKGIPFTRMDVFLRAMQSEMKNSDEKINFFGFGLEYNILKDRVISPIPGISAVLGVNTLSVTGLDATTTSIGLKASKKLPIITPFVVIASEKTKMEIDAVGVKLEPEETRARILAGIEFRLIPFTYLDLAFSKTDEVTGFQISAGIKK
ncbi:MAG: hypothetical protein J7L42_01600, partial [Elusimicrobia bacterium]|nr:hypothetical protein [Elusimicrobiota bacterium]